MTREFTISNGNNKFSVRFGRYFFFVLLVCAIILAVGAFKQTTSYNIFAVAVLVIGALYCLARSMTTLYKVVFDSDSRQVTVDVLQFDKIKHRHIIPFEALDVAVKTNYLKPGVPIALCIYANGKLLCKQGRSYGWSFDDLYDMEEYAKGLVR